MKKYLSLALALIIAVCSTVALSSCGKTTYADLAIVEIGQEKEYFGIAFREGSDLTRKVEDITLDLIKAGKLDELSKKYGVGAVGEAEYTPKADACASSTDYADIKARGKLVVGITDYKPMDYKADDGSWIGFDADYAKLVGEKLGLTVEFKEIEWDNKETELKAGSIDCIWNGMTITDSIEALADCTVPYMYNTQVAVVLKKNVEKYKDLASLAGKNVAAEGGSAGESVIKENDKLVFKSVTAQSDALLEVMSGASEACVIDYTMARALIPE